MSKYKFLVLSIFTLLLNHPAIAAITVQNQQELEQIIEKVVNQRTQQLQQKVNELEAQVDSLKQQKQVRVIKVKTVPVPPQAQQVHVQRPAVRAVPIVALKPVVIEDEVQPFTDEIPEVPSAAQEQAEFVRTALLLGGTPVFSSPFIGVHSAIDGTDLIVNAPTVNLDVRLLKQEQEFERLLGTQGVRFPKHPVLSLSGKIEGIALWERRSNETSKGDLNLASAEVDVLAEINEYISGFMAILYDSSAVSPIRVAHSRLFLEQGFITLGDLDCTPLYASIGQLYVPYGRYSSYMLSASIAQIMGRTRARALVGGITPMGDDGIYAAAFIFRGDTKANDRREGGAALGYKGDIGKLEFNISGSAISNIAESEGMQATGAPTEIPFHGFGESNRTEDLRHGVPGLDLNALFSYGHFSLITEYVQSLQSFDPRDLSFNYEGAKPSTLHLEGVYRFELHNKPGSIYLGYDHTSEALALFLPRNRYLIGLNYSFLRYTLFSLEYRHDVGYSDCDVASGGDSRRFRNPFGNADMVAAQFGIYF